MKIRRHFNILPLLMLTGSATADGQVQPQLAQRWFEEATKLCERDAGRLWGVSLCGPMEERVRVERRPVNRAAEPSDIRAGEEQVIEVEEYAEEPVVRKQARVVEEVRVGKEATERTETVRDTVRRTEVNVENLKEGQTGTADYTDDLDQDFRRNFDTNYGSTGAAYDTYAPAYRYGYEMANDPSYRGKDFSAVESDLQADYGRRYPNSTWERMKDSIRYGWDKVTGRTRSATR